MEITPKAMEITPKAMEITPKAMEIEYIRIKRFMQQGPIYCYFHNNPKCSRTFIVELFKKTGWRFSL